MGSNRYAARVIVLTVLRSTLLMLVFTLLLDDGVRAQETTAANSPTYLDPSQPLHKRVDDLLSRMTLEEKASQLVNQARAVPRLQIPEYDYRSEALHGVAGAGLATVFPAPIGIAATFDESLVHAMAAAIGTEGRVKYNLAVRAGRRGILEGLDFWAPNINIFRDPRWGRGQETYGEDPFLAGKMAVAFVTGMQGDDPNYLRVIATPKHYAVHSGPEPSRHVFNVEVSNHDMADTYLPAFRAAVIDGKAGSIMCAYNRINGEPACANSFLLEHLLRGAWNFGGYVVGDCDSIDEIFSEHHFTKSLPETAALTLRRGADNECIDSYSKVHDSSDYKKYLDAVAQGLLSEKELDVSVRRVLMARFRLGLFDPPEMVSYARTPDSELDSQAHRALALQISRESMVLLKNDGALPLGSGVKEIAVVGPLADSARVLRGNYAGTPSRSTTVLDGIRKQFPAAQVTYALGMNLLREDQVIPAALFSTEDGQAGVKGEYFPNKEFKGPPSVVRRDRYINLDPLPHTPQSLTQPEGLTDFSIRWTGVLTPDESAIYQLTATGTKDQIWLDGKLVADDFSSQATAPAAATIRLEKGHHYALRVESVVQDDGGASLKWLPLRSNLKEEALAAAQKADVIIAVVGITSQLEGEELRVNVPGFSGGDRTSLDLPKEEEELIETIKGTSKPMIVVLVNGSALSVNWASEHANAILEACYPGEEGGIAIAETLAGTNNPAGRLPVTFYKGTDQLPAFDDYSMQNRTYRYFQGEPLYPFGFGLSYSRFEYNGLKLSTENLSAGESLEVEVDVRNSSQIPGDEIIQAYLDFPPIPGAPLRALRAFERIHLAACESRHVRLKLTPRDLSYVNPTGVRLMNTGRYVVTIGGGQPGTLPTQPQAAFQINGESILPE